MMLVIRRKAAGPGVRIGHDVVVKVIATDDDGTIHLGFLAPRNVKILREELQEFEPRDYADERETPDNVGNV